MPTNDVWPALAMMAKTAKRAAAIAANEAPEGVACRRETGETYLIPDMESFLQATFQELGNLWEDEDRRLRDSINRLVEAGQISITHKAGCFSTKGGLCGCGDEIIVLRKDD